MSELNFIPKKRFMEEFGITRHTFRVWRDERQLPTITIGYRTFIPKEPLMEWLKQYESNMTETTTEDFQWNNIFQ